jgi:branched-chain amino acid transport system substrate-binding protein
VNLRGWIGSLAVFAAMALGACDKMDRKKDNGGGGGTGTATGTGTAKPETGTIVIGHFASMTGSEATFGKSTDNGIRLALAARNKAGGVKGRQIALETLDDAGKTSEAGTAVTRLINDSHAVAILGEVASSLSLAGGEVAQKRGVPMITPSSTNPTVTQIGDKIFRVCFLDDFQGWVMAKFASEDLKATKAALLFEQTSAYSKGLGEYFTSAFTKMGGKVTTQQAYSKGDQDLSAQLQTIKNSGAEVVVLPGYYSDVGTIIRQARKLGIKAPFLGGDGWDSDELAKIAGDSIEGDYYSNHYATSEDRPEVKTFVADYQAAYGAMPDGLAALGYDAALLLFDAMDRAASLGGNDLAAAIADTTDFKGVTGTFSIDENRDAKKSAVIIKYVKGERTLVKRITPDGFTPAE